MIARPVNRRLAPPPPRFSIQEAMDRAEALKKRANTVLVDTRYPEAVEQYTLAIQVRTCQETTFCRLFRWRGGFAGSGDEPGPQLGRRSLFAQKAGIWTRFFQFFHLDRRRAPRQHRG